MSKNDLQYSPGALSVLSEFHEKKIIYVEGPDDGDFWNMILQTLKLDSKYTIKPAGGITELVRYINDIVQNSLSIYVFCDSDYTEFLETQYKHANIIYTYGYSIENTLYSPCNIAEIVCFFSNSDTDCSSDFQEWLENFSKSFKDLLILDICSQKYKKRIRVMGDNCCRFLLNNYSCMQNSAVIEKVSKEKAAHFTSEQIKEVKSLVESSSKEMHYLLRGHFLTNATMNYIREQTKKTGSKYFNSISKKEFHHKMLACFQFDNTRADIRYFKKKFAKLK